MTECESSFFRLVDEQVRLRHACFLAEFFPRRDDPATYWLCFRPSNERFNIPNSCRICSGKYVAIAASVVEATGRAGLLSGELVRYLQEELG